jgi:hypothetical protein
LNLEIGFPGFKICFSNSTCTATAWQGDYLLCTAFGAGVGGYTEGYTNTTDKQSGMRLEYRARSAAVLAPIVNDPRGWLTALTGDVLRLVPEDRLWAADDARLFGGSQERVSDVALAAGRVVCSFARRPLVSPVCVNQ